jgi:hypothetical protein
MGANQNSSRNLAYIPKSTQIHNARNPAALKSKHEPEIYFRKNGADHGNRVRRDLRQVLHGMPVISGEERKVLSELKHRGAAVVMRQGLPARSVRRRWEARPRRASGAEKLGEAARLNENRGRAVARFERNEESDSALAGGETETRHRTDVGKTRRHAARGKRRKKKLSKPKNRDTTERK